MVYVDPLQYHGGSATFKWTVSCHMYADTIEELHAMAKLIGMRADWFQDNLIFPHYDLVPRRRKKAVKLGAAEVDKYHAVNYSRSLRGLPPIKKKLLPHENGDSHIPVRPHGGKAQPQPAA